MLYLFFQIQFIKIKKTALLGWRKSILKYKKKNYIFSKDLSASELQGYIQFKTKKENVQSNPKGLVSP